MRRRDVRWCRQLVEALDTGTGPVAFLRAAAREADGHVEVLRPTREQWARAGGALATGLTIPWPGGWLTIVPDVEVAEHTIFGHEAAHIVFGDVRHWDRASIASRTRLARSAGRGDPVELLGFARTGNVESSWRHSDGPQERRAELLGTLLESRHRRPEHYVRDRVDDFFAVRADR